MLYASDGAGPKGFAVHDRCVQFIGAGAREHGPFSCVKMRVVLQDADRSFGGIKARSTALQDFVTRPQRAFQAGAIFTLSFWGHVAALNSSSATVHDESGFPCLHF